MKIFYTTSLDGDKDAETIKVARSLLPELLKKYTNGKLVIYFVDGVTKDEQSVSEVLAHIRSADAFIGEMSASSQTLGFELAYANLHFVPSLYLYYESDGSTAPEALIANNPTRKLWIKKYTEDELEGIVKSFMRMVERQMETARTSFMSTKEIDTFVGEESDSRGVSKGEIIRQTLSEAAKKKR